MKFITLASSGDAVPIYGDGTQVRDFIYVDDIVDGMVAAQRYGGTGTYNLGTGCPVSVNRTVDVIERCLGKKITRAVCGLPARRCRGNTCRHYKIQRRDKFHSPRWLG